MMNLSSEIEMEIVISGLVGMLALGTWLFFRHDSNGEPSLFEQMRIPYDETPTLPILIPDAWASHHKKGLDVVIRIPAPDHAVLDTKRLATFEQLNVKHWKKGGIIF